MSDQESKQPDSINSTPEPAADTQAVDDVAQLRQKVEIAEAKVQENWDALLRAKAELENVRKRGQRDLENAHKYGLEKIALELLSVRDSMELGLEAASSNQSDISSLREGVDLTLKMLVQLMDKFNIKQLNPVNEKFNPEQHQAISMQEVHDLESNTVISVMQKGYLLSDRLLRPALVVVSKAPASSEVSAKGEATESKGS